jgi:hypothetical protein
MQRVKDGAARALPPRPGPVASERLVGLGFRYWLTGFRRGDISCWERAWCAYSNALGAGAAKAAVTDLSCWVSAINRHARRELETAAVDCEGFCRDECLAIEMIRLASTTPVRPCAPAPSRYSAARSSTRSLRERKPSLRPCVAPTSSCRHPSVMVHLCWLCRRQAPGGSEEMGFPRR